MSILEQISAELQRGEEERVGELTRQAIAEGLAPQQILDQGLIGGMNVIGEQFRDHEIFLPDVLLAARAMYAGMDELRPLLIKEGIPTSGKVVIGTVQGDLHDIGKNLVGIMLRGAGFEVIDLGKDVTPDRFVTAAEESGAQVIGMSALLTTTMPVMKQVIGLLEEKGLKGKVRTVIGGAPLSEDFARQIGADAYAFDGANAIDRVKALVG
ncbi:MAG: corrinoid protein [Candidatus Eisenbacteria sp.]|nr:corrinoid protein [Candidatus Eisenbacteria bacterium]